MFWILLFSVLYISKKYIGNNENYGLDERFTLYKDKMFLEDITDEKMFKIYETSEKLAFLESTNISIDDKLYEIGNRNIPKAINILNGGLLNDWNFEFFVDV